MITEIRVVPYTYILTGFRVDILPRSNQNFLSVRDPGNAPGYENILEDSDEVPADRKLCLRFSDVVRKSSWQDVLFTPEMAVKVKDFIDLIQARPESEMLFINCEAGICRSGALGTWVADYVPTMDYQAFRDYHHWIQPNSLVLKELNRLLWSLKYPEISP